MKRKSLDSEEGLRALHPLSPVPCPLCHVTVELTMLHLVTVNILWAAYWTQVNNLRVHFGTSRSTLDRSNSRTVRVFPPT